MKTGGEPTGATWVGQMRAGVCCAGWIGVVAGALVVAEPAVGEEVPAVHDRFEGSELAAGWRWTRENPEAWRLRDGALEIRVEPGNQWGPANDARNVLWREVPEAIRAGAEARAVVRHRPTAQWEQTDLVWYFDDGHMVKLGQEMVDGRVCIVMGREEGDRTRTIAIVPRPEEAVELRLVVRGNRIRGQFRDPGSGEAAGGAGAWKTAGETDLPAPPADAVPRISLQCYQGSAETPGWTRIEEFRLGPAPPETDADAAAFP